jgi:hypothetical protein
MRCPQCGLVHLESDQYCRRCNIDLRSGAPRPPAAVLVAAASAPALDSLLAVVRPWLSKISLRRRLAGSRGRTEPQPFPAPVSETPAPEPAGAPVPLPVPLPAAAPAPPKIPAAAPSRPRPAPAPAAAPIPLRPREPAAPKGPGLIRRLGKLLIKPAQLISTRLKTRQVELRDLTCIRCAAEMRIERLPVYGPGGPISLMLAVVVVFGLGFLAWPLFILSPVAVGLGVFYRRRGPTRWHCRSCGYIIPREG